MIQHGKFEYSQTIEPTERNARTIQMLTLQDVIAGGFESPLQLADPANPSKVALQLQKLTHFPERYEGFVDGYGDVKAYMKSNEWMVADELPFVEGFISAQYLKAKALLGARRLDGAPLGIFGLVADARLESDSKDEIIHSLLQSAIAKAALRQSEFINIVLHDHDPVLPIALDTGFAPEGIKAEASGAPGRMQQRFQLPI